MKYILYLLSLASLTLFADCNGQKSAADATEGQKNMTDQVEKTMPAPADDVRDLSPAEPDQDQEEATAAANADEEEAPLELEKALLWEITGKGLEKKSYLYGTIHLIDEASFFWPDKTIESYNASEKIVFEIDLDEMSNMGNIFSMVGKIMMKDGMTLSKLLTKEDYDIVAGHFKDMGLPMMMLEKMKPMFLTVFAESDMDLSGGMSGEGMQMEGTKSYEMEFYALAQEDEKEVLGLESMDDQISLFDSIPYADQATMLVETIKASGSDEGESELEEITKMYLEQDINAMVGSIDDEGSEFAGYEDLFLYNRNRNWIPLMKDYMAEGTTFFAVGAGHLGGRQGVIDLLQKEGYTLTPISQVRP